MMKSPGRSWAAALVLAASAAASANPDHAQRIDKARQVATAWLSSLMRGDTAVTTALSGVPFAMDRRRIIETTAELEETLEAIAERKDRRELRPERIEAGIDRSRIEERAFPADYVVLHLTVGGGGVTLCVRPGDACRVVGLSD